MQYLISKMSQFLGAPNGPTFSNFIIVLAVILLASLIVSGGGGKHH